MKRTAFGLIPVVLGIALTAGAALAQQKTLREQLIGTWNLVSEDSLEKDGSTRPLLGPHPVGTLLIDAGGHYSMILTDSTRRKWDTKDRTETRPEDYAAAAKGLVAQFGDWSVDEPAKIFTRYVKGALGPNAGGKVGKWVITLSGDDLTVVSAEGQQSNMNGGKIQGVFKRAK